MMMIGISGRRGAGKDAIADVFVKEFGFWRIGLADPMKRFFLNEEVFTKDQLFGPSANREEVDPRWDKSARQALQTLGTEWGRSFCEDLWVQILIRDAHRIQRLEGRSIVVTDCRFKNELDALKGAGAFLVRVVRPWKTLLEGVDEHASETSLDDVPDSEFDHVITNDGTLEDLSRNVRQIAFDLAARGLR